MLHFSHIRNRGAVAMISTGGDKGSCGKGVAAENEGAARARPFGHGENIPVTVTLLGVVLLDMVTFGSRYLIVP